MSDTFDAAAAWAAIPPDDQARLGAAIVEMVLCWNATGRAETHNEERPFQAALDLCHDTIDGIVLTHAPGIFAPPYPLPPSVGPVCRKCGCTENDACVDEFGDGCSWVEPDLCSSCGVAAE